MTVLSNCVCVYSCINIPHRLREKNTKDCKKLLYLQCNPSLPRNVAVVSCSALLAPYVFWASATSLTCFLEIEKYENNMRISHRFSAKL